MDLIGDFGGTHSRLALAERGTLVETSVERYENRAWSDPYQMILTYMQGRAPVDHIAIAAAGPLRGHTLRMTNQGWHLDRMRLVALTEGASASLVNDMIGQGHGLGAVPPQAITHLAGPPPQPPAAQAPALLVNIGTGLNVAVVHQIEGRAFVPPAEAGYIRQCTPQGPRFAEDLVSGRATHTGADLAPMAAPLAAYLHDLAHMHLPGRGIFLTGGLAQALAGALDWPALHRQMCADGPYADLLASFPLYLVSDDLIALRGAAVIASGKALI